MNVRKTTMVKKMMMIVMLAVSTLSNNESAAQSVQKQTQVNESSLVVNYLGWKDEQLVFSVELNNPSEQKGRLIISNQDGNELYKEFITAPVYAKRMFIHPDNAEKLFFRISLPRGEIKKVFSVEHRITEIYLVKEQENN